MAKRRTKTVAQPETEDAPLMPTGIRPRFLDRLRAAGEDLSRVNLTPESDQHQVTS